ncbi:MaoC/PaaZ C-terminal domain-containing protein [Caldinitratiruptor microaerophilus]|uniref:MaoC-like domain-containing protein n=1 Tax=Caldinitratiruptor microaerophilus TaxID=671077 RepID=A0AA35G9K7_9FIRM|nr:MaoC/PaaZ C-terminal domain-containing protein [Caldinitratiruptor microaerophilus]BDG62300.1 hypothetical protein caldi_33900 [Caldinitratiruptor microaerophilus]
MPDRYFEEYAVGERWVAGTGLLHIAPDRLVAFYGMDRVRFTAPVFIGDTIHRELEAEGLEERGPGDDIGVVGQRIVNPRGETVAVATLRMLVRRRPGARPPAAAG